LQTVKHRQTPKLSRHEYDEIQQENFIEAEIERITALVGYDITNYLPMGRAYLD